MGLFEFTDIWMLAIGKTIIHSLWIGLLIFALLRLALAHLPTSSSALRYGISVSALLILFLSVIATFFILFEPLSPLVQGLPSPRSNPIVSKRLLYINNGESVINTSPVLTLLGYIYFAGILFMMIRTVASVNHLKVLRKSGIKTAPEWQLRFSSIRKSLGIKHKVDFLESTRIDGPLLLGYLKPAIIVPVGMLSMLPVSQVEAIIMHELYHLKRRDFLINIVQLFIEGALFYNPAIWIISGIIRNEREHCCDDRVLTETDNPANYAKALIQIAEQKHFTRLAPGAAGSAKQHLNSRIKRILNIHTMKTTMRDKVLALALLAGSLIIVLSISGFTAGSAFIRIDRLNDDKIPEAADPTIIALPDTIPEKGEKLEAEELEAIEEARLEALAEIEELDWESMKEEMEEARLEALAEIEEIDWESMKEEMEEARLEALAEIEEIDWESMKEEMDEARLEALAELEEIDWEAMTEEMEEVRLEALAEIEEIDWEAMKEEVEKAHQEALKEIREIDWEEVKAEMKLDLEEIKRDIENSMNDINWDEIREDMREEIEDARLFLDSIRLDTDL